MNQRIQELARQAAAIEGWGPEVWQTTFSEKFAELIVRECAEQVKNLRVDGYGISGAEIIRKHFRS
jgi:hypothetical protein